MSEEGIPSQEPNPEQSGEASSDGGNYHDRIRAEPEFAVGEVQKKDSHIGKLNERLSAFKPLEAVMASGVDADRILELALEGDRARQRAAESAAAPAVVEKEEDEIYDPEIRALSESQKRELAERDARIASLEERLNITETRAVKGSLQENLDTALSRFSDRPELMEEGRAELMGAVEVLEKQAQAGDRNAQIQLDSLAGAKGVKTMKMMMVDVYDKVFEQAAPQKTEADGNPAMSRSTDTPSTTRNSPPENKVTVGAGRKVTAELMRETMLQATIAAGKDPAKVWN